MADVLTSYSGGKAIVAACRAAAKVWYDPQYDGVRKISPTVVVEGNDYSSHLNGQPLPDDWQWRGGTVVGRSITFHFRGCGNVKVCLRGEVGKRAAGGHPTIFWGIHEVAVTTSGGGETQKFSPDQL